MLDQLSILKLVTTSLESAAIPYMVTGSIAASHYGRPRMTRDLDLVAELHPVDVSRLEAILGQEFMVSPDSIRAAISRRGMFNAIHVSSLVKVDFVVRKDSDYRIEEFYRRHRVRLSDGTEVWMVTAEDLVLSKLLWAKDSRSEVQLNDVRSVLRIQGEGMNWAYLEGWAERLSVTRLLQEVR